jgi:hypothetical protein
MSCCGKIAKIAAVATGTSMVAVDRLFWLPEEKSERAIERQDSCRECDNSTWMTESEYYKWIVANGGIKKFLSEIEDLTQWVLLPKQQYGKKRKLFCRICKCWLPAKSYLKSETCPVNNPAWLKSD